MTHVEAGRIGPRTQLVALLGHPVSHSLSPRMHNAAFAEEDLDLVYLAFDVPPEGLAGAFGGLKALGAVGANVTVPHKEKALTLLDEVEPLARRVGAVNTIVNQEGLLIGHNTDVFGFSRALESAWGRGPHQSSCLVLGAGGAARAVVAGLLAGEAREVFVYNRTAARASALCTAAKSWGKGSCIPVEQEALSELADRIELIVNATSVGLGQTVKETPLPADILRDGHLVIDLVYGREQSALVRSALAAGAAAVDGTEMLVQQAARSFELWTGRSAPLELFRSCAATGER